MVFPERLRVECAGRDGNQAKYRHGGAWSLSCCGRPEATGSAALPGGAFDVASVAKVELPVMGLTDAKSWQCGRSSVVEHQLPKLSVGGSIPFARSTT